MVTETVGLSLKVDTKEFKTGALVLDKFATKATQAGIEINGFNMKVGALTNKTLPAMSNKLPALNAKLKKFTQGLKPAKNATQLLAYQAQDLAVQLSMGTSSLVAFGQQAPQAFSAFGPSGAVLGAIAGVGFALAGPLVAAFSESEEAASDFQTKIDSVTTSLKSSRLEVNKGAISLLTRQIVEADVAYQKAATSMGKKTQGFLGVDVEGVKAGAKTAEQFMSGAVKHENEQAKRQEALIELKKESLELSLKEGETLQTVVPKQDFNSFSVSEYLAEQQATTDKANKSAEDALIRRFAREDALWLAQSARNKKTIEDEARFKRQVEQSTLSTSANMFGQLADIAAAGGEEQFMVYKRFAQAQAGIQAAMAMLGIWGDITIPFPLKVAAMGVAGTATAIQIAQIEGTHYSAARENGGQVQAGSRVLVGERGPEVLQMGAQGGFVTPNHKLSGGESVTIVNQIGNNTSPNVRAEVAAMGPQITAMVMQGLKGARR